MLKLPNNAFVTLKGIENCGLFELVRNKTKSDMFDPIKNLSIYLSKFSLESQCIFLHILTDLSAAKIANSNAKKNCNQRIHQSSDKNFACLLEGR